MGLLNNKEVLLKVFIVFSGLLVFLTGVTNIFEVGSYTPTLVCFYLIICSIIVVAGEISPYILENYILQIFPFLSQTLGKGVFYIMISTFCFGSEMSGIGIAAGITFLISGIATITFGGLKTQQMQQPEGYSMEPTFMGQTQGYQPPNKVGI
ncbi:unnamed protein product [Blepharisma stoltei]|uniref:COPI associated protein n=1 Tax=Blepharisma stoltei TaxID=1481888 RepID=A0AAU9JKS3_9CILI|nr:unnamed protein product [Blepharisma stoltei]